MLLCLEYIAFLILDEKVFEGFVVVLWVCLGIVEVEIVYCYEGPLAGALFEAGVYRGGYFGEKGVAWLEFGIGDA